MSKLKGKVTLITGAGCGYGMGRGFPLAFAKAGSHLLLNHYQQDPQEMDRFRRELENLGVQVVLLEGDITEEQTLIRMVEMALEVFGNIDVLLNTAGVGGECPVQDITLESWNNMLAVNLTGTFLACKHVLPVMIRQCYGRIINMTSQNGQKGGRNVAHYAAAKAGVIGFTKSLAREVGRYHITANCIAPGPINTQMLRDGSEEWKEQKKGELVIQRFGEIDEVTPTAIMLASDPDGNLYTGQTLGPNCGDVML